MIAYSNHAFYDANIATVPDRLFTNGPQEEIVVASPEEARTNLAFFSESSLTIGIVAFSEAQQKEIEASLAELATLDQRFNTLLEAEQIRTDDKEFVGLFIKNLENVQGDERDLIIMTICYAPTADGRMRMNFGPINQAGGERCLNVIFSRAKKHMMVVSSITGNQITNTHNEGASQLARFLDYAATESRGLSSLSGTILGSLRPQFVVPSEEQQT